MKDNLNSPCKNCPFSKGEGAVILARERLEEIINHDTVFSCHKTVEYGDDECGGDGRVTPRSSACAGFLGFMMKSKGPNQLMQIGFRFGILSEDKAILLADHPDIIDSIEENAEENRIPFQRKGSK